MTEQSSPAGGPALRHLSDVIANPPQLPEEVICGLLRRGGKCMLTGPSKAGKSFALIGLAFAAASGGVWLGFQCRRSKVLLLNMEIQADEFDDRMLTVYNKLPAEQRQAVQIENIAWRNLRGKFSNPEQFLRIASDLIAEANPDLIVTDPIYKLEAGNENDPDVAAKVCAILDRLAETGPAVVYCHHHSKGVQAIKSSMDRGSGSGVFARDANAMLDLLELAIPPADVDALREKYGNTVTAWQVEATTRGFAKPETRAVFFGWPFHYLDVSGILDDAMFAETARSLAFGRQKGNAIRTATKDRRVETFRKQIEEDEAGDGRRTPTEYSKLFGVTRQTIYGWLKAVDGTSKESA